MLLPAAHHREGHQTLEREVQTDPRKRCMRRVHYSPVQLDTPCPPFSVHRSGIKEKRGHGEQEVAKSPPFPSHPCVCPRCTQQLREFCNTGNFRLSVLEDLHRWVALRTPSPLPSSAKRERVCIGKNCIGKTYVTGILLGSTILEHSSPRKILVGLNSTYTTTYILHRVFNTTNVEREFTRLAT